MGCALVCPTSLYVRIIRFPTFCRSLPSVGAYSQYPAWSGCRRSADVPRADHDRVSSSPWQGGFKERVYCACLPSICLIFSTYKYAATAFNFKHTFYYRERNQQDEERLCFLVCSVRLVLWGNVVGGPVCGVQGGATTAWCRNPGGRDGRVTKSGQ